MVNDNIKAVEEYLKQSEFIISRRIGEYIPNERNPQYTKLHSYFLYLDDVNKKWLLTSPYQSETGKIRNFNDLIEYETFDIDGIGQNQSLEKGLLGTMGAIAGGVLGGGVGALIGGMGMSKLIKTTGTSSGYGFTIKTTDFDINNPMWIYDFYKASHEFTQIILGVNNPLSRENARKKGIERTQQIVKDDFLVINEMTTVFEYILRSREK